MSLANRCDRCGALIPGEANFEKENFDLAIMIGAEISVSYEDLCPNCMKSLRTLIANFQNVNEPKPQPKPAAIEEAPKEVDEIPQEEPDEDKFEIIDESADDVVDDTIEEREPRPLRNAVVKQIPIKLKTGRGSAATPLFDD